MNLVLIKEKKIKSLRPVDISTNDQSLCAVSCGMDFESELDN